MGRVHALTAHGQQHQRNGHAGDDLQADLLRRGQAEIPPLDDFDVVIGKTNRAEGQRGKHHQPDEGIGKVAPQQCRQEDSNTDEHAAHGWSAGLFLVALGTVLANVLADLKLTQLLNDERPDEQSDEHRGETGKRSAKRQIPEDAEGSEVGKKFLIQQPVKQTSSATRAKNSSVWGYLTGDRVRLCVCICARTTAATSCNSVLTTIDGCPISRSFFARCGIPLLFPSDSRFIDGLSGSTSVESYISRKTSDM